LKSAINSNAANGLTRFALWSIVTDLICIKIVEVDIKEAKKKTIQSMEGNKQLKKKWEPVLFV
jgi:hypothetical protein